MLTIIEIGDIAWQGRTEPVFCRGDDGNDYIVKGTFAGRKALIAEWVANSLGREIGLPIPEFALLKVDPAMFDYGAKPESLDRLGRGILFGSRRVANVVEIRHTDLSRIDLNLQARVLAFDWWIANSDRVFIDGAGNPNLLWSEEQQALIVIDHNLAFDPDLMADFWNEHAFREANKIWSESFRQNMETDFRRALAKLPSIWNEVPEEWLESDTGLTRPAVESLLWRFEQDADKFWSLL
jgi:hypothetical protein